MINYQLLKKTNDKQSIFISLSKNYSTMKKSVYTIILGCVILLSSCSEKNPTSEVTENDSNSTTSNEVVETTNEEDLPEEVAVETPDNSDEIQSKYNYDQDWELIKEAILNKDIQGVGAWAASDEVDSEYLIMGASEEFVIEALKKTSYSDLRVEEGEDEVYLVFYAEELGTDEEGNEVGTSFSIYLKQGDPNLLVEYYIAAG